MSEQTPARPAASDHVECPAAMDPCVRMFIVALLMLAYGLYCAYDLFVATGAEGGPKYSMEKNASIYLYNVACLILVPIGAVCLAWGVVMVGRKLLADQEGIGFVGQEKVAWQRIYRIVTRGKGLLDLYYKDQEGQDDGVIRLDSWKLKNFAELVALVESKTPQAPVETARR
jgi:hypothetical protein